MSDAAIVTIAGAVVTVVTIISTQFALWIKLKYGVVDKADEAATKAAAVAHKVAATSEKIDDIREAVAYNTTITAEAKEAAEKASGHARECDTDRSTITAKIKEQDDKILYLEGQIGVFRVSVESLSKEIASTRHEMRGHLQAVVNKLDLMAASNKSTIEASSITSGS